MLWIRSNRRHFRKMWRNRSGVFLGAVFEGMRPEAIISLPGGFGGGASAPCPASTTLCPTSIMPGDTAPIDTVPKAKEDSGA